MKENINRILNSFLYPKALIERLIVHYGVKRTYSLLDALKKPVTRYTLRVNTLKCTAEELVDQFAEEGIDSHQHPCYEDVIQIKLSGPNELPVHRKTVTVDKFAAEAVMLGAHLYAPGALRSKKTLPGDKVSVIDKYDHHVGSGISRMTSREMLEAKKGIAVDITHSIYTLPHLRETKAYEKGLFYSQNLPAILTSKILDPRSGETIIDMNAAPGGKATHIAQLISDDGKIVAIDRSKPKIKRMQRHCERLGIQSIKLIHGDSSKLQALAPSVEADRILIDPPCSALGVRPKLYEIWQVKELDALAEYQRRFIKEATNVLKPGGVIVYSTCTLTQEENELNMNFASTELGLKILSHKPFEGVSGELLSNFPQTETEKLQRFYPDIHDTPGFFIGKLQKPMDEE
ncbi:MAG: RsmB/NOP family class I SAM-dependent RNA methyltransferase [Promethearchaeota archaeon]